MLEYADTVGLCCPFQINQPHIRRRQFSRAEKRDAPVQLIRGRCILRRVERLHFNARSEFCGWDAHSIISPCRISSRLWPEFCLRFPPGLSRTESQLRGYQCAAASMLISIGLAPMGSQLSGYDAVQPFNRGFPRDEPGGERVSLSVERGSLSIVRSIGASPMEAGLLRARFMSVAFCGWQLDRILQRYRRSS